MFARRRRLRKKTLAEAGANVRALARVRAVRRGWFRSPDGLVVLDRDWLPERGPRPSRTRPRRLPSTLSVWMWSDHLYKKGRGGRFHTDPPSALESRGG